MSLRDQSAMMRAIHPSFRTRISRGILQSVGEVQPSGVCSVYRVRIEYRIGALPSVFVEEPALRERKAGQGIPHTYSRKELCLFLPGTNEWRPDKPLATTLVPWTTLWLFYYESWLVTGEWMGGGVELPA